MSAISEMCLICGQICQFAKEANATVWEVTDRGGREKGEND